MTPLLLAFVPLLAQAGVEDTYVARLRDQNGYKCTEVKTKDGYVCVSGKTYVLIPKDLASHATTVFYAHGDSGVCSPGISGENYLLDQMPTLRKANAIAVFPVRTDRDYSFPLGSFTANIEKQLGDSNATWIMAAHSWGGKFISRELSTNPALAKRVTEILFLDAAFDVESLMLPYLMKVMEANRNIKIKAVNLTKANDTKTLADTINKKYPGTVTVQSQGGDHCSAPKFFTAL